eukprot:12406475-Karenia_brevis.AAC.1
MEKGNGVKSRYAANMVERAGRADRESKAECTGRSGTAHSAEMQRKLSRGGKHSRQNKSMEQVKQMQHM